MHTPANRTLRHSSHSEAPRLDSAWRFVALGTRNDILLIADEVQCGVGRAGSWWACDQTDTSPDILVFAKGIASGYPIAGDSPRHVPPAPAPAPAPSPSLAGV